MFIEIERVEGGKMKKKTIRLVWADKFREILNDIDLNYRDKVITFANYCDDEEDKINERLKP